MEPLIDFCGFILPGLVASHVDAPPINQSVMNGLAFSFSGWDDKNYFKLSGEIPGEIISKGRYILFLKTRIFKGAPVPDGTDISARKEL